MGARGSRRASKPAKKSKFSAQEKIDRGRAGRKIARMGQLPMVKGTKTGSGERQIVSAAGRSALLKETVSPRYRRNPLPRANRNPKTARGGGAPRRPRG